jgi:hypothetical protein
MSVNSGCLTKLSYYHLTGNCGGLLPARVALNGKTTKETAIQVTWTAKDEQSTKKYTIERSNRQDGGFEAIGTLKSNQSQSSTYLFVDNSPLNSTNYYRIRIETTGSTITYSNVIMIKADARSSITAYPNPVKDILNINIRGNQNQSYRLSLFNNAGQTIYTGTQVNIQNGSIQYRRDGKTTPGLYFLQVNNLSTGETNTYKIIFQ